MLGACCFSQPHLISSLQDVKTTTVARELSSTGAELLICCVAAVCDIYKMSHWRGLLRFSFYHLRKLDEGTETDFMYDFCLPMNFDGQTDPVQLS